MEIIMFRSMTPYIMVAIDQQCLGTFFVHPESGRDGDA